MVGRLAGAAALLGLLGAAGCERKPEQPSAPREQVPAPAKPVPAAAPARAAAERPAGCADSLAVALNQPSFDSNGSNRTFSAERLEAFRARAETAFKGAADDLCRSGRIKPEAFKGLRRLSIETASGAMEPTFFQDDQTGKDMLVFQLAFAEGDLALPDRKSIQQGLRCWDDPDRKECAEMGD